MNLSFRTEGDLGVVAVGDARIDASVAIEFKERIRSLTAEQTGPVVLDLHQVEFVDSSGLGAIVAVHKLLGPGRKLVLIGLGPSVTKVMALTRMDTVLAIHPDLGSALNRYGAAAA